MSPVWYMVTNDVQLKFNPGFLWQSSTEQEEGSFHQQIRLKFRDKKN